MLYFSHFIVEHTFQNPWKMAHERMFDFLNYTTYHNYTLSN